jgi:hypothetical protein
MKVEVKDLELNKVLDTKSKVAIRGGLQVETTAAAARSNYGGCTAGTHSVCHIDGTDDGDYPFFSALA